MIISCLVALLVLTTQAANLEARQNSVELEFLGAAPFVSFNYERSLSGSVVARGGVGALWIDWGEGASRSLAQVILGIKYGMGSERHRAEAGLAVLGTISIGGGPLWATPELLLRYRFRSASGVQLGLGVAVLVGGLVRPLIVPLPSIGLGYAF